MRQGIFKQFFGGVGRTDLAKAAHEAAALQDADIGLTTFLDALPVTQTPVSTIDINPRRLLLGHLLAGEQRQVELVVSNQGRGNLQGTMTVTEGGAWLKIEGAQSGRCAIATQRQQKIPIRVDTRGVPAGGTFGAKLTVNARCSPVLAVVANQRNGDFSLTKNAPGLQRSARLG